MYLGFLTSHYISLLTDEGVGIERGRPAQGGATISIYWSLETASTRNVHSLINS